eukprot:TRINITY_DN12567_c0_g2_i1.p1 TRINITY_DN12567_c0_g2~~TRINITY_DN12567_c0_g2_i1.p1  ORF type:complete len:1392 (-),score=147.81 TRINITY_DN12567_c0_g2_i1:109-3984(-)
MDPWTRETEATSANTSFDVATAASLDVRGAAPFFPFRDIRIANSAHLLPAFSPGVTDYQVLLDDDLRGGHLAGDVSFPPVVHLELQLDMQVIHSTCMPHAPPEVILAGEKAAYDLRSGLVRSKPILLHRLTSTKQAAHRSSPYDLIVVEVHEGIVLSTENGTRKCEGEWSLGRSQFYSFRFRHSNHKIARGHEDSISQRRLSNSEDLETDSSVLQVLKAPDIHISLKADGGTCKFTHGPFAMPVYMGALDSDVSPAMWTEGSSLILCLLERKSTSKVGDGFHLSALTTWNGDFGDFGFGPGVSVALQPSLISDLRWPLTLGLPSVGFAIRDGAFRLLSVETRYHGEIRSVPLVLMSSGDEGKFSVQLMDPTLGNCAKVSPNSVGSRFICRVNEHALPDHCRAHRVPARSVCAGEPPAMTVSVLVTCSSCVTSNLSIGVTERKLPGSKQAAGPALTVPLRTVSPWVGWTVELKPHSTPLQWMVTSLSESGSRTQDFVQVALVSGLDPVTWLPTDEAAGCARLAGKAVLVMVLLTTLILVVGLLFSCVGLPVAKLALLPATNAATLSLQFLWLMTSRVDAPVLFLYFREPLDMFLPLREEHVLVHALFFLFVVFAARCAAICQYIAASGKGAASNLPHSLCLGAWELRMLSLVALPLASSAWTCAINVAHGNKIETSISIHLVSVALVPVGVLLITCLLSLAVHSMRQVRAAFAVGDVFCTKLPGSEYAIFVDRVCDQLRALPLRPMVPSLFGSWADTPSWLVAPPTASIEGLEHVAPPVTDKLSGDWDTIWPAGPWGKLAVLQHEVDNLHRARSADSLARDRGTKSVSIADYHHSQSDSSACGSTSIVSMRDLYGMDGISQVRDQHPVKAVATFVHGSGSERVVVGVACTPWIDVALTAKAVRTITKTSGEARLRCHVGQLCGPLTSGRLSACFDWGTRWPLRWSCDLLLKVALGAYIAVMQRASPGTHQLSLLDNFLVLGSVIAALFVCVVRPYVHFVDNAGLIAALAVVFVSTSAMTPSIGLPISELIVLTVLASLVCFPLVIASAAGLFAIISSVQIQKDDLHDELLSRVIRGWNRDYSPADGSCAYRAASCFQSKQNWESLGDDASDSCASPSSKVDVMLMTICTSHDLQIACPAQTREQIVQFRLNSTPTPSGSILHLPCGGDRVRVPLGASILFPSADPLGKSNSFMGDGSVRSIEDVTPLAALLTETGSRLVYANPRDNEGMHWREAVRGFLALSPMELMREIETIIAGEDDLPKDGAIGRNIFYVIEIVGLAVPQEQSPRVIRA